MAGIYGESCYSQDGHFCDSKEEAEVDNHLFQLGIPHELHVQYPFRFNSDWYIPDTNIYIEYFGLVGEPDYDEKIQLKKQLAKQYGLRLVEIYPKDIAAGQVEAILINQVANKLDELPAYSPLVQEQKPIFKFLKRTKRKIRHEQPEYKIVIQEKLRKNKQGEVIRYFIATRLDYWHPSYNHDDTPIQRSLKEKNAIRSMKSSLTNRAQAKWRKKFNDQKSKAEELSWCGTKLKQQMKQVDKAIKEIECKVDPIRSWSDLTPEHPLLKKKEDFLTSLQSIRKEILKGNTGKIITNRRFGNFVALRPGRFFARGFRRRTTASTKKKAIEKAISALKEENKDKVNNLREKTEKCLPWIDDLEPEFHKTLECISALEHHTLTAERGRVWWNPLTWLTGKLEFTPWKVNRE